jgi:hypothetical protein
LGLRPAGVTNVEGGRPENRRDGRFRISDFGMWPYFAPNLASLGRSFEGLLPRVIKFVRSSKGGTRFGRRMHDEKGIVAERAEGLGQKAEIAVPEKLVRAYGEVGVEKDFQAGSFGYRGK